MSWATCYSGSNNIHFNMPPIMADGRNFSSWQPDAVVNNSIKKQENIQSNWEYRSYLTNNANQIMKFNNLQACEDMGLSNYSNSIDNKNNSPYLFQSSFDTTNMDNKSDLKSPYLTREQLQLRTISPFISLQKNT
jgi:hypothetical protein